MLRTAVAAVMGLLFAKVLGSILLEYRYYFPADFDASWFLAGREHTFVGAYRAAFYMHILAGPVALLLGLLLMASGGRPRLVRLHRLSGRLQMLVVLVAVAPSGLVMSRRALAGPIATWGFTGLAGVTAICAAAALYSARARRIQAHRRWATRCFLMLVSPLLLRVVTGAAIVLQLESDLLYRLNAWGSWLVPLVGYEVWWRWSESRGRRSRVLPAAVEMHPEALP